MISINEWRNDSELTKYFIISPSFFLNSMDYVSLTFFFYDGQGIYFPAYRSHDIYTHATNFLVDQITWCSISLFPYELSMRKKKNQFSNMIGKRFCSPADWRWGKFCLISQLQPMFTSKSATNLMISILRMSRVRVHTASMFTQHAELVVLK